VGFTPASHELLTITLSTGEQRRLVLKRVRLSADWTARRTSDQIGREAALLSEGTLAGIWESFHSPYRAFARDQGEIALLMDDLSPFLLPDQRVPLHEEEEERLLHALAEMHGRYWNSDALSLPWLALPHHFAGLLDPISAERKGDLDLLPSALRERVGLGWIAARKRLPDRLFNALRIPASELSRTWDNLPQTLVHGDVKVANFALMPAGQVAAFDWAMVGAGPATLDLGWYLAVNASRLARPKERVLSRYRALLTEQLKNPLADSLWTALENAGIICGARMLLWSKALAVDSNVPGARSEWNWWVSRLEVALDVQGVQ
jgi:Phosphotransferase enzyme family